MQLITFFLSFFLAVISANAVDSPTGSVTGLPIPRFVSLKAREVNMRSGPGITYPSKINYKCAPLPLEILSEFENWRLVRDADGNEGWIHEAMLDGKKHLQVISTNKLRQSEEVLVFRIPDFKAQPIAKIEVGAVGKLIVCKDDWCKISLGRSHHGWINKKHLWGVESEVSN
jgi:SH3-like domain-containing protein